MIKGIAYYRYSTDRQNASSIDDQRRNCMKRAEQLGCTIIREFRDEQVSGATINRIGYKNLLDELDRNKYQILFVDDLSRLNRDFGEQDTLLKHLEFNDVRVIGVSENFDSEMQGAKLTAQVKGIVNEMQIESTRFQTKRGLEGLIARGGFPGGKAYGYSSRRNESGVSVRIIDEDQACVVRRILTRFADGASPLEIAKELNVDRIPSPMGGLWQRSAIHGDPKEFSGILNNQLYVGIETWNKFSNVRNPITQKKVRKPNPKHLWITEDAPHLRIVEQELWDKVKKRQQAISLKSQSIQALKGKAARSGANSKYLLSGILKCGSCGSNLVLVNGSKYGCSRRKESGNQSCEFDLKVKRIELEDEVLTALTKAINVDALSQAVLKIIKPRLQAKLRELPDSDSVLKKLDKTTQKISRLVDAISRGADYSLVEGKLNELKTQKVDLERQVADEGGSKVRHNVDDLVSNAIAILPNLICNLKDVLRSDVYKAQEAISLLSGGSIKVVRGDDGTPKAKKAALVSGFFEYALKMPEFSRHQEINVVAGAGFEPTTFGL